MSVTSIDKDFDNLTLTVIAQFDAPVEQVWELWADPRRLERWWGPPSYPATVERHELRPGGEVRYYMTSPENTRHYGWWEVTSVDAPTSLEFTDGFGDSRGKKLTDLTTTARVSLVNDKGGTKMELVSSFDSRQDMDQLDKMGMTEGMRESINQMDAALAGLPEDRTAAGR